MVLPPRGLVKSAYGHLDFNFKNVGKETPLSRDMANAFNDSLGVKGALSFDGKGFKLFGTAVDAFKSADELDAFMKKLPTATITEIDLKFKTPRSKQFFVDAELQTRARAENIKTGRKSVETNFCTGADGKVKLDARGVPIPPVNDVRFNAMLKKAGTMALGATVAAGLTIGAMQLFANSKNGCYMVDTKETPTTDDDTKTKLTDDSVATQCTCSYLKEAKMLDMDLKCKSLSGCSGTATCGGTPKDGKETQVACLCNGTVSKVMLSVEEATWLTVLTDVIGGVGAIINTVGDVVLATASGISTLVKNIPVIVGVVVGIIIIAVVVYFVVKKKPPAASASNPKLRLAAASSSSLPSTAS
jgi:hypothetical protein